MTDDEKIEATLRMIDEGRVPEGFTPLYELFRRAYIGDEWAWEVVPRKDFEKREADWDGHIPNRRIIFFYEPTP